MHTTDAKLSNQHLLTDLRVGFERFRLWADIDDAADCSSLDHFLRRSSSQAKDSAIALMKALEGGLQDGNGYSLAFASACKGND